MTREPDHFLEGPKCWKPQICEAWRRRALWLPCCWGLPAVLPDMSDQGAGSVPKILPGRQPPSQGRCQRNPSHPSPDRFLVNSRRAGPPSSAAVLVGLGHTWPGARTNSRHAGIVPHLARPGAVMVPGHVSGAHASHCST